MTQSGQGDEPQYPAARPAHEGVVLPADGSGPWIPGVSGEQVAPAGGQPWGQPWGPGPQQAQASQPVSQPLPPYAGAGADATQYLPPVAAAPVGLPPERPAESTQYLGTGHGQSHGQWAPQGPDAQATQYIAPVPAGDAQATQYIAPVPAGPAGPAGPHGPDAQATQYIAPVPAAPAGAPYGIRPGTPEDRQPPAEFDSLFRTDAGPERPDSTQQLPRFDGPQQRRPQRPYAPAAAAPHAQPESPRRRSSPAALIAAGVVGLAVVGLGVGALLSGGDEDNKGQDDRTVVTADSSPTTGTSAEPAADPAKAQAEGLDKLLADSNNSRASVIRSVENIKKCDNLGQAAVDLRAAAVQRENLVTRLQGLPVDNLPENARLSAALTKAWKSSASADSHYAAWADQVAGKKGCKDGRARQTAQTGAANRASGEATQAKQEAAALWNTIAGQHGLTKRDRTHL
ncbi:hypothetical protein NLX86_28510 [Streptomyces sp. A3M-1-3]|uniref:hypothetical protein n=1 Tax=Streptomyces sp. A3M-1-3 TaxID=2962044 RepID=UPI0020B8256E|nr:hypothetical protein [Streptomyces sp. A3M-1-3]MCP3821892.1 hypothetical protein [Streptomyces sp. A3M-1-3]